MEYYELTPAQKNINDLQCFYEGTSISVICGAVIFEERLEKDLIISAAKYLIRKHDIFALGFRRHNGRIMQYYGNDNSEAVDYKYFNTIAEMRKYCSEKARTPFSSECERPYRMTVFDIPDKTGIMLCASHLISDAWTYGILARDVYEIYNDLKQGIEPSYKIYSYQDNIQKSEKYLASEKYQSDKEYWKEKYKNGIERTPIKTYSEKNIGITGGRYTEKMSEELTRKIDIFCKENNISTAVLIESAVIIYLARINMHNNAVTIGIPVLGRSSRKEKNTAGMYISTLPMTVNIDKNEAVLSVIHKIATAHREIYRHRNIPYKDIIEIIRSEAGYSGRIYDVMVSCQNIKTNIPAATEWFSNGYSELPLILNIDDRDDINRYTVTVDHMKNIISDGEIRLITARFIRIISEIISSKDMTVKNIPIMSQAEYDIVINRFNDTTVSFRNDICVHKAFSETAAKYPDRIAVIYKNMKLTYAQIDKMSDALASHLIQKGINKNDIVPIIARRSQYTIIAMLSVLKAGGAYMPISPDYPVNRVRFMIDEVNAKLALIYKYECDMVYTVDLERFDFNGEYDIPNIQSDPKDICYIIYTSGSTGKPKGTMITHRNVMNYCNSSDMNVYAGIIKKDMKNIISVTDFVFDIFVTESILSLLNGMTIYLTDDAEAKSQSSVARIINNHKVDILQTTPTKMRTYMFDKANCGYLSALKCIILGGEELPTSLTYEIRKYTNAKIYNIYGPAETTVWASVSSEINENINIGKPLANTRIYILDDMQRPVPIGISGEICISGECVSAGYFNDTALTAKRFKHDPFYNNFIMYKTGDIGSYDENGQISFLGRTDDQIKLRGLRIELGEIENVICGYKNIIHAAVICKDDNKGEKFLSAYYTSSVLINEINLKEYMSRMLPSYMIPKQYVRLENMPMTQSGKTDKKALYQINVPCYQKTYSNTAPEDITEKILLDIIRDILNNKQIGVDDNIFESGYDSFKAMELSAEAEKHGLNVSVSDIYKYPTVRLLCRNVIGTKTMKKASINMNRFPLKRDTADHIIFDIFKEVSERIYNMQTGGIENIGKDQKYIFCPNHQSDLDCLWVWTALSDIISLDDTCALIAAEHLNKDISRLIFGINGGIPIARTGDFMPSIERAVEVIKYRKRYMLIHPEGTRSRTGKLGTFKQGAAIVSINSGVPIIPVYIGGASKIYPVYRKIPRLFDICRLRKYPLFIRFGTAVYPENMTSEQITAEIRRQIVSMKKEYLSK